VEILPHESLRVFTDHHPRPSEACMGSEAIAEVLFAR
jgi:hypothetical protein